MPFKISRLAKPRIFDELNDWNYWNGWNVWNRTIVV